jgi:hypothetical protein
MWRERERDIFKTLRTSVFIFIFIIIIFQHNFFTGLLQFTFTTVLTLFCTKSCTLYYFVQHEIPALGTSKPTEAFGCTEECLYHITGKGPNNWSCASIYLMILIEAQSSYHRSRPIGPIVVKWSMKRVKLGIRAPFAILSSPRLPCPFHSKCIPPHMPPYIGAGAWIKATSQLDALAFVANHQSYWLHQHHDLQCFSLLAIPYLGRPPPSHVYSSDLSLKCVLVLDLLCASLTHCTSATPCTCP